MIKQLICYLSCAFACIIIFFSCLAFADELPVKDKCPEDIAQPLKAAIFIQNHAGEQFSDQVSVLNDQLSSMLTEKGFSVIDKGLVANKFSENKSDWTNNASALRIAQTIGADYILVASLNSYGEENKFFKGEGTVYKTNNANTTFSLRISLKVLDGNQGGTIYGDIVTASERISTGQNLVITTSDIMPRLIENGAKQIADNVSKKIEAIRKVKINHPTGVEFVLHCNVDGATVELDGAVIGTAPGKFMTSPGLHQLKVSKEFLTSWERNVNVIQGQNLNVTLELSEEGYKRYATLEQFKHDLSIAKEQSAADIYVRKTIAEGEKKRRENSYDRIEGPPTTNIYK